MQLFKPATSEFLCVLFLFAVLFDLLCLEIFVTHKHHIQYLLASECKPCSQPCGPSNAQLNVQPCAPSGKGSSSSLSPASIAEDVFFVSTNDDQVNSMLSIKIRIFNLSSSRTTRLTFAVLSETHWMMCSNTDHMIFFIMSHHQLLFWFTNPFKYNGKHVKHYTC